MAVDGRWHRAGWVRTLRYEVPQHARYRRCRQAHALPAQASHATPRRAGRLLPLCCGEGVACRAQAAPRVTPLGPCRAQQGQGGSGHFWMEGDGLTVLLRGLGRQPTLCVYFLAAMDCDRQAPGQDTPLCILASCSLFCRCCIYRHHDPFLGR